MKGLMILFTVLLLGCAEVRTLEELELSALRSGDWSAVEARERALARRAVQRGAACANGDIAVCETRLGTQRCSCGSREAVADMLGSW